MTPDQIALAQLEVAKLQAWITALAIFLGPLAGVIFTLWFQGRKERKDQQAWAAADFKDTLLRCEIGGG